MYGILIASCSIGKLCNGENKSIQHMLGTYSILTNFRREDLKKNEIGENISSTVCSQQISGKNSEDK